MENRLFSKTSRKSWLNFLKKSINDKVNWLVLGILFLASFFRFYRISEYMTFLGDEGRDAIIAREILSGNFTLLGPRASAGDFFLGPIYYYMMAPFLWVFNYDPVGPAIMVAILGVLTVLLVYIMTARFFGRTAGLIASSLYAISPIVIAFSRSSWNPNPVPFFTIVLMYTLYFSVKNRSQKLFVIVGFLLGILLQLHYIATFIGVIIFVFVLIGNFVVEKRFALKNLLVNYASIFLGFILGFSPFIAFEVRNGFPNTRTILNFVFVDNFQKERVQELSHLEIVQDVLFRIYARLTLNFPPPEQVSISEHLDLQLLQIASYVIIVLSLGALFFVRNKLAILLILSWFLVGLLLFGFYKRDIYDYYYGFLFPVPFILIGNLLSKFSFLKGKLRYVGIVIAVLVFSVLFYRLISNNPFKFSPNNQKSQAEMIANLVLEKTDGKPYNFALITLGNSDHVFRYFFEVNNRPPIAIENMQIDPERNTVTDQLMVVCDAECDPVGHPLWEVAGFGPATIDGEWKVPFVTIYRLVHAEN